MGRHLATGCSCSSASTTTRWNCAVLENCRLDAMRSDVTPFLWFVAAFVFAAVWKAQGKGVYLALSLVFAILAVRSYFATKNTRAR